MIITTAPITADITDTINKEKVHPSSPAVSEREMKIKG
jgi:hypothetical protein